MADSTHQEIGSAVVMMLRPLTFSVVMPEDEPNLHRLSYGFPQESFEYIGDGVVSQSGTAIEREL
jgi:hypothetical protein